MRNPRRALADVHPPRAAAPAVGFTQESCVASTLPDPWITVTMQTRQNHDVRPLDDVEDAVGKLPEESAPYFAMNCRKRKWIALDRLETLIDRGQELVTKFVTPFPVPGMGVADVRLGSVPEPETHFLRFSSSRTWGQPRVAPGSLRCVANRLSSSAR